MRNFCIRGFFLLISATVVFGGAAPVAAQYGWGVAGRRAYRLSNRYARVSTRYTYGVGWRSRRFGGYYGAGGYYGGGSYGCYGSAGSYGGGCYGGVAISYDCCNACPVASCGDVVETGCVSDVVDVGSTCSTGGVIYDDVVNNVQLRSDASADVIPTYAYVMQTPYRELVAQRVDAGVRTPTTDNKLRLTIHVPNQAKVFINGKPTSSTGSVRKYVTPAVAPNRSYVFSVRTEYTVGGRKQEKTQEIRVQPNAPSSLAFKFEAPSESVIAKARPLQRYEASGSQLEPPTTDVADTSAPLRTVVAKPNNQKVTPIDATLASKENLVVEVTDSEKTLITFAVPDDAQVFLGGIDTNSHGSERVFQNRRLKPGERFPNYHVTVKYRQNGEVVTRSVQVDLVGGKRHHFSLASEELRVASR